MAETKISALPGATVPLAGTEIVPIVQNGETVKVAASYIAATYGGVLPVANGGTGQASAFTINGVPYASSTSALATSTALRYDGTTFNIGAPPSPMGAFHAYISSSAQMYFQNVSQSNLYVSGINATLNLDAIGSSFPGIFLRSDGTVTGGMSGGVAEGISLVNASGLGLSVLIPALGSDIVFGNGSAQALPFSPVFRATNGSGTDIAGANMSLQGGRSTGSGASGYIRFLTAGSGSTGTSLNAASEKMRLHASGGLSIGNTTDLGAGNLSVTGVVKTASYVVTGLPAAATVGAGARAYVTDATVTTFASVVVGSGGNAVPVYSDGTNWRIG